MNNMFFRIDKRLFQEGDMIEPDKSYSYQDNFDSEGEEGEIKKAIEDGIIETCKPKDKFSRKTCLFLFWNLSDAIRYYVGKKGSNLYVVENMTIDGSKFHMGDMIWFDIIIKHALLCSELRGELPTDSPLKEQLEDFASRYWRSEKTYRYVPEILTDRVKVVRQLCNNQEVREQWKSQYSECCGNVEKMPIFRDLFISLQ